MVRDRLIKVIYSIIAEGRTRDILHKRGIYLIKEIIRATDMSDEDVSDMNSDWAKWNCFV